jgi:hypoxanthine phosphoribosyltransferase
MGTVRVSSQPAGVPPVLISANRIRRRVSALGREISADYAALCTESQVSNELILVGVLKGAFMLIADLARTITTPLIVDFVQAASYGKQRVSSGTVALAPVKWSYGKHRHVLVVEDVLETGRTLDAVIEQLQQYQPRSLRTLALLRKPGARRTLDYTGFQIENTFVVGYGLDDAGRWRNLPYVGYVGGAAATSGCANPGQK